jgi:hypothetical protein
LTRDAALAARRPQGALPVKALEPEQQLREVARALGLRADPSLLMTRCSLCNALLARASRTEAERHVPASVSATHEEYWRCTGCGKWYWRGTHAERIETFLLGLGEDRAP